MTPSNFKKWLWSAKVLTTIVWILFPLGYFTVIQLLNIWGWIIGGEMPIERPEITDIFVPLSIIISYEITEILNIPIKAIVIPPIALVAVLFLFSLFPAISSTKKFFKMRGNENAVIEYQYIRKVLFGFLIALVALIITLYFLISFIENLQDQGIPYYEIRNQFPTLDLAANYGYTLLFVFLAVSILILLKLLLQYARKQFRFYYAKACFEIIKETESEIDKARYLFLGLDWYNKFIKRVTKSSIDVETIYSKIISHSQLSNNILFDTIVHSFHNGDELKPLRHMLNLLSCWKEGATLVKESLRTKIRESSDLLIPIVTVIITIIATFFLKPPQ